MNNYNVVRKLVPMCDVMKIQDSKVAVKRME